MYRPPMASAVSYTASFAAACVLLLTASWCLNTAIPDDMPESIAATILDAVCRANWHVIKFLDAIGASHLSVYWRETIFQSTLHLLVRGSVWSGQHAFSDPQLTVTDTFYSGVPVRVFEPAALRGKTNRPVMVFFHGGWASLGFDLYEPIARELAKRVPVVVVAVRFRMPPEHTHPAAVEDCIEVTNHVIQQAHLHDFDPNRVAVSGDGAGGQLAAAVALKIKRLIKLQGVLEAMISIRSTVIVSTQKLPSLRQAWGPTPMARAGIEPQEILICPWLQLFDLQTPSYIENRDYLPGLRSGGDLLSGWMRYGNIPEHNVQHLVNNRHTSSTLKKSKYASYTAPYLYTPRHIRTLGLQAPDKPNDFGDEDVSSKLSQVITDPLFAPLMADDKDFLHAPSLTYIVTAGYDVTRDDGLIYWRRLKDAGVSVEHAHYQAGFHSMLALAPVGETCAHCHLTFGIGKRVVDDLVEFLLQNI